MGLNTELDRWIAGLKGFRPAIVLDVDRTVVAGTSWYKACKLPGLLISPALQPCFDADNEAAYGPAADLPLPLFRARTLGLITVSRPNAGPGTLAEAGTLIARHLEAYPSAAEFIRLCGESGTGRAQILYLTSGYTGFIDGVIRGLVSAGKLPPHDFSVFGSECLIGPGGFREGRFLSQAAKGKVIRRLHRKGVPVDFYADDSFEYPAAFRFVELHGGTALRVPYEKGSKDSKAWQDFLRDGMHAFLKRRLMLRHPSLALTPGRDAGPEGGFPKGCHNAIGIPHLPRFGFFAALAELGRFLREGVSQKEFRSLVAKMSMKFGNHVRLRSRLYYYWLPQSLREDFDPLPERWRALLMVTAKAAYRVDWRKVADGFGSLSTDARLILSSILEHGMATVTATLFAAEAESVVLRRPSEGLAEFHALAGTLAGWIAVMHGYGHAGALPAWDAGPWLLRRLIRGFNASLAFHKGMKELDDYGLILRSNRNILSARSAHDAPYDAIIVFPYGGIDLGYTLQRMPEIAACGRRPDIINCYYSSKKALRNEWPGLSSSPRFDVFDWITPQAGARLRTLAGQGGKVLLYDHNATTFGTLAKVKSFLEGKGLRVDVAVATVNYDNIAAALLDRPGAEPMTASWREIIGFPVTAEYVTAFNTWGTSEKSLSLYRLFRIRKIAMPARPMRELPDSRERREFKVCRVHNICDLLLSLAHGATMIGIHAVQHHPAPPGPGEAENSPAASDDADILPLPASEIESIRQMQKHVPIGMLQALIIERELPIGRLERLVRHIWEDRRDKLIQTQFRLTHDYVAAIREHLGIRVMGVVGLFQADFKSYFAFLDALPESICDHILIDMSKHQPDILERRHVPTQAETALAYKADILIRNAPLFARSKKRILIADDIPSQDFIRILDDLKAHGVRISGLDMQNILELPKQEQVFTRTRFDGEWHVVKQRKSSERFAGWREVIARL